MHTLGGSVQDRVIPRMNAPVYLLAALHSECLQYCTYRIAEYGSTVMHSILHTERESGETHFQFWLHRQELGTPIRLPSYIIGLANV